MDLLVLHGSVGMAVEVKVWRENRANPEKDDLVQIERYLNRLAIALAAATALAQAH